MATTWSIVARVNSYHMASGYSQDVGRWTRFTLEFGVVVIEPSELEVAGVVWARALLVSEAALESVQGRAK